MEELKDIKYILQRHQKGDINVEETFNEISELIKLNGYFIADDIKDAFELGKKEKEFNLISKDDILDGYKNDIDLDNFVNYVGQNGFFSLEDVKKFYQVGKSNKNNETDGDAIKDFFLDVFVKYLTTDFK